jgi:hypothetical protein
MKKLGMVLACVCIATMLAQAAGIALLWSNGTLTRQRVAKLLAVLYGIEPRPATVVATGEGAPTDREQPSWEQIEQARVLKLRQIEMREQSLAAERMRLRDAQTQLEQDRLAFDRVKSTFESKLQEDREGAVATGRDNVRALWENMKPKQAKEQILQMYERGDVDEVVRIVGAMSPNKQAKIAAEFKTGKEPQVLAEITKAIRDGQPQVAEIDQAQQGLAPPAEGSP